MESSKLGKVVAFVSKKKGENGTIVFATKVRFNLHGNTIHCVKPMHEYNLDSIAGRGEIMADIGRGIANFIDWPELDIKWRVAPVALVKTPTAADMQLERIGLVLIDFKLLVGQDPKCPHCNMSNKVKDLGYPNNARRCKGMEADVKFWYLLAKRRKCCDCPGEGEGSTTQNRSFLDSDPGVLAQLPAPLAALIPVVLTAKSGHLKQNEEENRAMQEQDEKQVAEEAAGEGREAGVGTGEDKEEEERVEREREEGQEDVHAAAALMDLFAEIPAPLPAVPDNQKRRKRHFQEDVAEVEQPADAQELQPPLPPGLVMFKQPVRVNFGKRGPYHCKKCSYFGGVLMPKGDHGRDCPYRHKEIDHARQEKMTAEELLGKGLPGWVPPDAWVAIRRIDAEGAGGLVDGNGDAVQGNPTASGDGEDAVGDVSGVLARACQRLLVAQPEPVLDLRDKRVYYCKKCAYFDGILVRKEGHGPDCVWRNVDVNFDRFLRMAAEDLLGLGLPAHQKPGIVGNNPSKIVHRRASIRRGKKVKPMPGEDEGEDVRVDASAEGAQRAKHDGCGVDGQREEGDKDSEKRKVHGEDGDREDASTQLEMGNRVDGDGKQAGRAVGTKACIGGV